MRQFGLKVGELARRTGLTVRALHHYDAIGLLSPSGHSGSGHRLYAANDIARLQRIRSLRQLGFSLEEIRTCLDEPAFSPLRVVELHLARLREQMALQSRLCKRLEALAARLRAAGEVSADEFIETIEGMTMVESYYTPEQLETLKRRREAVGEERMAQAPQEWAALIAEVKAEMEKGTDPSDPAMQALARRWRGLIDEFTGGDKGIEAALSRLWNDQGPALATRHGGEYDPRLFEYIGKALAVAKQS